MITVLPLDGRESGAGFAGAGTGFCEGCGPAILDL
jgi:hypothetical protein